MTNFLAIAVAALVISGCGVSGCNDDAVVRAKQIEILIDKPGARITAWDYQWSQDIKAIAPQCWNEGVER
jgi:outer membrane murein-binding lipoprotein Lpp